MAKGKQNLVKIKETNTKILNGLIFGTKMCCFKGISLTIPLCENVRLFYDTRIWKMLIQECGIFSKHEKSSSICNALQIELEQNFILLFYFPLFSFGLCTLLLRSVCKM